jgi:hypothetical protein
VGSRDGCLDAAHDLLERGIPCLCATASAAELASIYPV